MKKLLSKHLYQFSKHIVKLSRQLYTSQWEKKAIEWHKEKGDDTLVECDLSEDSIVFDLGGYDGQWSSDIFSKYRCTVYCFEPVESFYKNIKTRFIKNEKIIVNNFGLDQSTREAFISLNNDSSSLYRGNRDSEIRLENASDYFNEHQIKKIDLMKINIEGGEYDLIDHLIETKYINNINNLLIQFHTFYPDAVSRRDSIRRLLMKTHIETFNYDFVWENWKLK